MMFCGLFLVFIVSELVASNICNETISVFKDVPETYQYTYYEAYESDDCMIWCTKSRQAVNIGTRQVTKLVNETVSVCCEGYIEDDSYEGDGLKCIPICNPPCENGYCRNPNQCSCEPGYAIDPNDILNRCVPLCLEGCSTPNCLSTCSGSSLKLYEDYDTSETDMCYGTCLNGTCVAPGVCHCDPGYRRVLENCEPSCSSCVQGSCVGPGQCECDPGWREDHGSCLPVCSGCEHGTCIAPNQCECNPGFIPSLGSGLIANNTKCKPYCSNCTNATCVAPEICVCDPGWYMNEDGLCIAPNVCKCEEQCETAYTTVDGTECDCFNNSDASKKCEKATCRKISNVTSLEDAMTKDESQVFTATQKRLEVQPEGPETCVNNKMICMNEKSSEFTYHWIYGAIIIIELLVIICMLVVLERKHLLNRLKTNKFIPQQGKPRAEVAVHYTSSVTCSKIKETTD